MKRKRVNEGNIGLVMIGVGVVGGLGLFLYARNSNAAVAPPLTLQARPLAVPGSADATRQVTRVLQQQLKDLGFRITMVDGVSGPETQAAISAFIAAHPSMHLAAPSDVASIAALINAVESVYSASHGTYRAA